MEFMVLNFELIVIIYMYIFYLDCMEKEAQSGRIGFSLYRTSAFPDWEKSWQSIPLRFFLDDDTMAGGHFSWLFLSRYNLLEQLFFMKITCW